MVTPNKRVVVEAFATRGGVVIVQEIYDDDKRTEMVGWDVYLPAATTNNTADTMNVLRAFLGAHA
jgi:hypothetical protein